MESTQEKGNPENNKLKQEGVRLRNGMGTPGDGMSRAISVIALREHPGHPLSPRETRTVGTQMMCHTTQRRESPFHGQSLHLALLCLITPLRPSTSLLSKRSLASDPSLLQATVSPYNFMSFQLCPVYLSCYFLFTASDTGFFIYSSVIKFSSQINASKQKVS